MKQKNYVYKITKKGQKDLTVFNNYGFYLCQSANENETIENIYAKSIKLNVDNPIFKKERKIIQQCYDKANEQERKKDFSGFPEENEKELCNVYLCFADNGFASYMLFINSSIMYEYYNTNVIDKSCKELIDRLIQDKLIRKVLAPKENE